MTKGSKHERRPADVIGSIAHLIRILALAFLGANATLYTANAQSSLNDLIQQQRDKQQRQRAQPEKNETETQSFKRGCNDFDVGRMSTDALNCVSVLGTALNLIAIFEGEGGAKGVNICIPKNPPLPKDVANMINRHPDLMDDNEPISVGLLKILAHEFPCGDR
jgi:hypothetical protein